MIAEEAMNAGDVITSTFLINVIHAYLLFDSGENRSFISVALRDKLQFPIFVLPKPLNVEIADGKIVYVSTLVPEATLCIEGTSFPVSFIPMLLLDLMRW